MDLKEQKGITLIAVVVMLVVMGVLTAVGVKTSYNVITNAKFQTLNTNMLLVQAKEKTIAEKHSFDDANELVGIQLVYLSNNDKVKNLIEKGIIENVNDENYYVWDQSLLDSLGLDAIKINNSFFIVNYSTDEIIFPDGFKNVDGKIYYELSKMLE